MSIIRLNINIIETNEGVKIIIYYKKIHKYNNNINIDIM